MIIPDINLLIYAYDSASPFHAAASSWWEGCLSGRETVGLAPVVLFGFVRLTTNARVFRHPLTPTEAAGHVRSWVAQPVAQVHAPPPEHVERVLHLLDALGTAGNLVTDAQIAALALQHEAVVHTADVHFIRFPGVRWTNPLSPESRP